MDARVRLEVLGAFALRSASQVLVDDRWPRSKAKALLKLLAITPGHRLHREQVAELVWPDLGPAGAADQLYKNLHFLRSRIAEPGFAPAVRTSEERLELEPGVEVDVDRFRTLAARARAGGGRAAYIDALQVYRGELLPDDLLEEWAAAPRDELAAMARDLRLELLRIEEERGDLRAAIGQAQSVLLTEPTCEPAHRALMRLLADSGDRAGAIRQYHRCLEALRRELEVDPSEETEALHRRLLEEGVARPVSTGAENLPLLEELGDVTRRTGEVDRSVALYEASLARALEAGDDAATLRLRGKAALGHILRGDLAAASAHFEAARRSVSGVMPAQFSAPQMHYLLAQLSWHGGRYEDALQAAERATEASRASKDPRQEAAAYEVLALSCHALGDWRRGVEAEVRRQQLAVDDAFDVEMSLEGHLCLWEFHLYGDRPSAEVEVSVRAALATAEAAGSVRAMALCEHALGALHFLTGRWLDAHEELSRSVRLAQGVHAELASVVGMQRLGRLETARGRLEEGRADLEMALKGADTAKLAPTPRHSRTRILASLAQNRLQAGSIDEARRQVEAAVQAQDLFGRCITCDALLGPVAVTVYLASGDLDLAETSAAEAEMTATAFGGRSWLATADLARATVLAATGALARADRVAQRAAAAFEAIGQPYDLARSLALLAGIRHRTRHGRPGARALSTRADGIFAGLGAASTADPIELILAARS